MDNVFEDIQDVRRLKLDPGDILLVSIKDAGPERLKWIADQVREKIPAEVEILVVTGDIQMAVLTQGQVSP